MNSRQYELQQQQHFQQALAAQGIREYQRCVLSADRTKYEITLPDNTVIIIPSGFNRFED
jgi:hypothetical protein